jgi:hypothetical protein
VAQEDALAHYFAWRSRKTGIPANRTTVIGHYQINSVSRPNCPGIDKRVIDRIVAKTQQILTPVPVEDPSVYLSDIAYQIPKIVRLKGGARLLVEPLSSSETHWTIPEDQTLEVELFGSVNGFWIGRRRGATGAFFFANHAIDAILGRVAYPDEVAAMVAAATRGTVPVEAAAAVLSGVQEQLDAAIDAAKAELTS